MNPQASSKVMATHLGRDAYLYVRQSTLHQVFENQESTRRQYDLRQRAVALGWPLERVIVIDSDLGQSGASAQDRAGFQRLVAEVGTGRAGIVMGLEVSRLARNSSDWHRLLEICALTDTLILDEDGLYDPAHFNDRLLLGLKGTMSEAELHVLRARLQGGYLAKARRGELCLRLPVGLVYDEAGQVRLDPDQQVRDAVRHLLETFGRTGTASAVLRAFHAQGLSFPSRPGHGPHQGELVWQPLTYSRVLDVLHNPRYAGAYALGRTQQRKLGNGQRRTRQLGREDWTVLLPGAHDGYIDWATYEENQRRLRANNWRTRGEGGSTPPREGSALLQGVAVCGLCGQRMAVRYCQRQGRRVPYYGCRRGPQRFGGDQCQEIPGATVDAAVSQLLVEAMTPLALEVTVSVQEELTARAEEVDRLRREQVERARYEAEAARRRYLRVDPDHRLVADHLEADWNDKLRALTQAQAEYERKAGADAVRLREEDRQRIGALASDFPALWQASTTSDRDRKRMLRLLIEDVTLVKGDEALSVHVRFRGGHTHSLSLPRPLPSWKTWLTPAETVREIDGLLDGHTEAEIAEQLNARGFRSGKGTAFHADVVGHIRRQYGLKSRYARLREAGWITADEIVEQVGVTHQTLHRWHREGRIEAKAYNRRQHLYDPTAGLPGKHRWPSRKRQTEETAV